MAFLLQEAACGISSDLVDDRHSVPSKFLFDQGFQDICQCLGGVFLAWIVANLRHFGLRFS